MALRAFLKIENDTYSVLDLDYRLSQPIDQKGKPSGTTTGGQINFTILANEDEDAEHFFQKWVISIAEVNSGYFELPITNGTKHRTTMIFFDDAYCTDLSVYYSSTNEKQLYMKISLSATQIFFRKGVVFRNKNLERK